MRRHILFMLLALGAVAGHPDGAPQKADDGAERAAVEPRPTVRGRVLEDEPRPTLRGRVLEGEPVEPGKRSRISLEDAAAIVRQAYGGRVVSSAAATASPAPGRPKESGHRVRVDIDGRVKTVFVDARGRIHENAE